jgi:hypothetical protein
MARSVLGKTFLGMTLASPWYGRERTHAMVVFRSAARRTAQPPPPDVGRHAEYGLAGTFLRSFFSILLLRKWSFKLPLSKSASRAKPETAAVLTKAVLRAAGQLGLTNKMLATVIGLSEATVSRMRAGGYALQPGHKPFELAVLFVRLYRSLDAIVGGDDEVAATWLKNRNIVLDDAPLALIQTVPGLMNVIQYLDARRAVL